MEISPVSIKINYNVDNSDAFSKKFHNLMELF